MGAIEVCRSVIGPRQNLSESCQPASEYRLLTGLTTNRLTTTSFDVIAPYHLLLSTMPTTFECLQKPTPSPDELTPLHQQNFENDINNNHVSIGNEAHNLHRHLSLFDLVCIGVGATVGSGIYVVTGLIAHSLAGPSTFISWSIAGLAACTSGLCYAELGVRFPSAGSTYVYARETMGEFAAVVAGACLTLEYVGSASAVARSWGDKVVEYVKSMEGKNEDSFLLRILDPGWGVNPCAFLVSFGSVLLLLNGVKESKLVTNIFTTLNVTLLLFMSGMALMLAKSENMTPLVPPQFGISGIIRGATSSFFGYIGFDEICCIASEAKDPGTNLPRAIVLTLIIVTSLYIFASIGLVGMVPYQSISETSGFPDGFRYRGFNAAGQVAALGELIALPFVVMVTVMAQPRLQYAMAQDGILHQVFAEVDEHGNLVNGLKISGILMTTVATLIPFVYLDDLISSGILIAFTITDVSVVLIRRKSPADKPFLLEQLLVSFVVASLLSGFFLRSWLAGEVTGGRTSVVTTLTCFLTLSIAHQIQTKSQCKNSVIPGQFLTPFVPVLPLVGIFVNLFLIAQLELGGLLMIAGYLGLLVGIHLHNRIATRRHHDKASLERIISLHETSR